MHKHHRKNIKSYSEVYKELKERAQEVELSTTVDKTKSVAQKQEYKKME